MAGRCGLKINKGKSNILLYNHRGIVAERVAGVAVAKCVRYLGTDMGNGRIVNSARKNGQIYHFLSFINHAIVLCQTLDECGAAEDFECQFGYCT